MSLYSPQSDNTTLTVNAEESLYFKKLVNQISNLHITFILDISVLLDAFLQLCFYWNIMLNLQNAHKMETFIILPYDPFLTSVLTSYGYFNCELQEVTLLETLLSWSEKL